MPEEVYIISGCRTGIGSFQGQYAKVSAVELGRVVIAGALKKANVKPDIVDDVVMGHVLTAGLGQNPARQASMKAEVPQSVPAIAVNMLCGSGLKAVTLTFDKLRLNEACVAIAGGMESMSLAHHVILMRTNHRLGDSTIKDTVLSDGLTDAFHNVHMGKTAENIATKYDKSRYEQDNYALNSVEKACIATDCGYFNEEIVGVPAPTERNKPPKPDIVADEYIRRNLTIETLEKLRPAFQEQGTVTAGNASGINDGAAALLFANSTGVNKHKLKPLAKIIGTAEVGCDPLFMGLSPIEAIKKLLGKIGWDINSVDLFEINEAFAVQALVVREQLGLNPKKVNVCGGGVALGHPIGASGARVLVTLLHSLRRLGLEKGVAALCVGGGMGIAIAIEIVNA